MQATGEDAKIIVEALKFAGTIIQAIGTVLAALIIGVAGSMITGRFARERASQDRESQWRQHAIELAKLEAARNQKMFEAGKLKRLRPSILDFLANYRDLQELGTSTPKELYLKIQKDRINPPDEDESDEE
jgi:hypothetical protein